MSRRPLNEIATDWWRSLWTKPLFTTTDGTSFRPTSFIVLVLLLVVLLGLGSLVAWLS